MENRTRCSLRSWNRDIGGFGTEKEWITRHRTFGSSAWGTHCFRLNMRIARDANRQRTRVREQWSTKSWSIINRRPHNNSKPDELSVIIAGGDLLNEWLRLWETLHKSGCNASNTLPMDGPHIGSMFTRVWDGELQDCTESLRCLQPEIDKASHAC